MNHFFEPRLLQIEFTLFAFGLRPLGSQHNILILNVYMFELVQLSTEYIFDI